MTIFMDDGGGVTSESIKYFRDIIPNLQEIIKVEVSFEALRRVAVFDVLQFWTKEYTMILTDMSHNEMWLSGVNCSYGGEGPNGSYVILRELGFIPRGTSFNDSGLASAKAIIFTRDSKGIPQVEVK